MDAVEDSLRPIAGLVPPYLLFLAGQPPHPSRCSIGARPGNRTARGRTAMPAARLDASEAIRHVGAHRPPADVGPPYVRGTDAQPLNLPEVVQEIQHQSPVELVQVLYGQAPAQV